MNARQSKIRSLHTHEVLGCLILVWSINSALIFQCKMDLTGPNRTFPDRTGPDRTGQNGTGQDRTRLDHVFNHKTMHKGYSIKLFAAVDWECFPSLLLYVVRSLIWSRFSLLSFTFAIELGLSPFSSLLQQTHINIQRKCTLAVL